MTAASWRPAGWAGRRRPRSRSSGQSVLRRVYWVAVPEALRARRANRLTHRRSGEQPLASAELFDERLGRWAELPPLMQVCAPPNTRHDQFASPPQARRHPRRTNGVAGCRLRFPCIYIYQFVMRGHWWSLSLSFLLSLSILSIFLPRSLSYPLSLPASLRGVNAQARHGCSCAALPGGRVAVIGGKAPNPVTSCEILEWKVCMPIHSPPPKGWSVHLLGVPL
jgi:hypothetical protein